MFTTGQKPRVRLGSHHHVPVGQSRRAPVSRQPLALRLKQEVDK
jgi:hypothetical protein